MDAHRWRRSRLAAARRVFAARRGVRARAIAAFTARRSQLNSAHSAEARCNARRALVCSRRLAVNANASQHTEHLTRRPRCRARPRITARRAVHRGDDVRRILRASTRQPTVRLPAPLEPRARYAAEVPPCAPTTAEFEPYRVGWADIAFGIATYNAQHECSLLAAAGETWLPAAAGADLLLVTDADDPRSDDEIAPRVAGDAVAVHVHRCLRCRETRPVARTKVLEPSRGGAALAVEALPGKFDADSLPIHHLLRLLDEMHAALGAGSRGFSARPRAAENRRQARRRPFRDRPPATPRAAPAMR